MAGGMAGIPAGLRVAPAVLPLATGDPSEAFLEGALWLGAVILVVIVAAVVAGCIKRRHGREPQSRQPEFTIAQLRDLRTRGELSATEYETLVQQMTGARQGK